MSDPHSTLEIVDGIATFTMTRPEARNALSLQVRDEIAAMIETVRGDDEIKALIITGSGGVFCAGGDTTRPHPYHYGDGFFVDIFFPKIFKRFAR